MLHTVGNAENDETVTDLLQHAGVEGSPAQVIDRDARTGFDPRPRRVLSRRGNRFGGPARRAYIGQRGDLAKNLHLVRPPVRRVGDHHLCWSLAHPLGHPGDDPLQETGREQLGGER